MTILLEKELKFQRIPLLDARVVKGPTATMIDLNVVPCNSATNLLIPNTGSMFIMVIFCDRFYF